MEKDINSLSGIEFENLCQQLLQKMEFETETTKASGDGGIDIIARYDKPLLKGKYIIQCKRYSGSVGEPVIRDAECTAEKKQEVFATLNGKIMIK